MNVAAILKQKGRAVTTARPTMTLMEIANELAAKRIGAIVIVGARGGVAGIISERDIIRALSVVGPDCLTQPVSQSMTKKVVTCQETDTLQQLMAMMTARRFRHLPVMDDDALVGIISIGDIVKHHVAEVVMEATSIYFAFIYTVALLCLNVTERREAEALFKEAKLPWRMHWPPTRWWPAAGAGDECPPEAIDVRRPRLLNASHRRLFAGHSR